MKTLRFLGIAMVAICSKSVFVLILVSFLLTSCGTVFCAKDKGYEVPALTITANVPNADVYINGNYVGQTPFSYFGDEVEAKKITVKKYGYRPQTIKPRKLKGWAYVNFVPWPMWNWIWGYFLDRSQRKCWKYKEDEFYFELKMKN